ncbi:MAG: acyltransferase [Actinomycetota bacterium]|nr:acyltransferase [Actinomycetota bacterium]
MSQPAYGGSGSTTPIFNVTARPLGHVAELDGLRGLAVIGVLAFHADHLPGGFLGVDLFFVLSGWLITRLLLIETSTTGGVDLMAFWGRRMRRLLPAVLALLVVVSGYAWLWGDTASRVDTSNVGPWAQWYVANWHAIGDAGDYWALFSEPSMFDHLWSLAIEEQFYVVWPVAIALLWRRSRHPERTGWILMTSGVVLSTLLAVVLAGNSGATRVYMGTDTRAASILCGAVAAMPISARAMSRLMRARAGSWVLWLAVGVIALMWWRVDGATASWLFRGGLTAHAMLSAIVISSLVARREADIRGLLSRVVAGRGLQWCGRLSYSLYLWHWPVYIVVADRTDLDGWRLTLVRVAATVVVSVTGYQLVEQYVRRRAQWAHGRHGTISTAVAMAAVSIWWVALPTPARLVAGVDATRVLAAPPTTSTAPASTTDPPVDGLLPNPTGPTAANGDAVNTTAVATTESTTTTTSEPQAEVQIPWDVTTVLWHGDSVAHDAAPAIVAAFAAMGIEVTDLSFPGSRLTELPNGDDPLERIVTAAEDSKPQIVFHQLTTWDTLAEPIAQRRATERLAELAASIGATLVVVTSPVEASAVVDDIDIQRHLAIMTNTARDADEHIEIWDQMGVFGTTFTIDIDGDGIPERKRDGVHLCPSGAARFAVWLTDTTAEMASHPPTDHTTWLGLDWANDDRYNNPPGACEPVPSD